ncbi:MAG: DNA-binding protein [Polyangiaceae bacterium]|nr:DNA-binding protein [Polyangiaceae bacterium]
MNNIDSMLRARVDAFASDLSALIKQAALEAVANALKGGEAAAPAAKAPAGRKRGPAPAAAKAAPKAAPKAPAAAPAAPAKRKAGQKRSPDEIAKTTDKLLQYIAKNSNQRIEEIAKGVGTSTKELTLPIKKLIADGEIIAKGEKRATRYSQA